MQKTKQSTKTLKILTTISAFAGVMLSVFSAIDDNFTHRYKRLMYFTAQSNLWIGFTFLALLLLPLLKVKNQEKRKEQLYVFKYVFTVSITMTGLVFCAVLAPFAPPDYRPWAFCNVLTHVVTPILAIADFLLDDYKIRLTVRHCLYALLPFLIYFSLASVLGAFGVDFGRGEPYPYFFMDYHSPVGIFGVGRVRPYLGSFYWWTLFSLLALLIAYAYAKINNKKQEKRVR